VPKNCGCSSTKLTIFTNGLVTIDEREGGCTAFRFLRAAFVQDLTYVRHVKAGVLPTLCLGAGDRLVLSFADEAFEFELALPENGLAEAHQTVLRAALGGRGPSAPLATFPAANGSLTVAPEFTTLAARRPLCLSLCHTDEVISVKTKDFEHVSAALPSFHSSCLAAVAAIDILAISRISARLVSSDLVLLCAWPCAFLLDLVAIIALWLEAVISVVAAPCLFFCRKTTLSFAAPGPAKTLRLQPIENPTTLLRTIAANVAAADAAFRWPEHGTAGAAKAPAVFEATAPALAQPHAVVLPGAAVVVANPIAGGEPPVPARSWV
jgi:hypothetical protein